jgi:D-glycero-D-manno-heptose 1,7-bisphosphate phosphatase
MKLIILDRDGVINHDSDDFIKSPGEWIPIDGSLAAMARLDQAGYCLVVATNQSGIARGLFDMTTLNAIHRKMHTAAQQAGANIEAIFFCPHAADDDCDCRKPRCGMLQEVATRFHVDLKGTPAVGDSLRDLQSGYLSGCIPYLVLTGKGKRTLEKGGLPPGTIVCDDLATVANRLLDSSTSPS